MQSAIILFGQAKNGWELLLGCNLEEGFYNKTAGEARKHMPHHTASKTKLAQTYLFKTVNRMALLA